MSTDHPPHARDRRACRPRRKALGRRGPRWKDARARRHRDCGRSRGKRHRGDVLRSALFGVSAHDPFTYVVVAVGFVALAVAAGTLPRLQALRVDPVQVIRMDS